MPPPVDAPLSIVLRTPRLVVVDKPAGLLSVPGLGPANQDCVPARLRAMIPQASGPLTVHRLDMETSGLLVLALDPEAHRFLSRQFEERRVEKRYVALVPSTTSLSPDPLALDHGEIDLPMRLDPNNRPRQVIDHDLGKPAQTRWRIVVRDEHTIRLELEPLTGRSHQLRMHCLHGLGRAIVGDRLYSGAPAPRLMLHAERLVFTDPEGIAREVVSPVPF